jgi:hypothetical protein
VFLFSDTFSNTEYMYGVEIVSLSINIQLETVWKQATVAHGRISSQYLPGRTEEIHDQSQSV